MFDVQNPSIEKQGMVAPCGSHGMFAKGAPIDPCGVRPPIHFVHYPSAILRSTPRYPSAIRHFLSAIKKDPCGVSHTALPHFLNPPSFPIHFVHFPRRLGGTCCAISASLRHFAQHSQSFIRHKLSAIIQRFRVPTRRCSMLPSSEQKFAKFVKKQLDFELQHDLLSPFSHESHYQNTRSPIHRNRGRCP